MDLTRQLPLRVVWLTASVFAIVASTVVHTQGRPNLTAPPPKSSDGKPDLSGIWRAADDKYRRNLAADGIRVPFQPWAAALFKQRQGSQGKGNPSGRCLPRGVPAAMLVREYPWKI